MGGGWVGGVVEISYYSREERKKPSSLSCGFSCEKPDGMRSLHGLMLDFGSLWTQPTGLEVAGVTSSIAQRSPHDEGFWFGLDIFFSFLFFARCLVAMLYYTILFIHPTICTENPPPVHLPHARIFHARL